MKKYWILALVITVLLIGGGVLAWRLQGTEESTINGGSGILDDSLENDNKDRPVSGVNNASYVSENLGIRFTYPENLFVEENEYGIIVTPLKPNDPKRQSDVGGIISMRILYTEAKTADELVKNTSQVVSTNKISISGKEAHFFVLKDAFVGNNIDVIAFFTKQHILNALYYESTSYTQTYRSILDSLSFIE